MIAEVAKGTPVVLVTPGNARLDGAHGVVLQVHPWGCYVATGRAATGTYRAAWCEMLPVPGSNGHARPSDPTGEVCGTCGGINLRRAGSCLLCSDCGSTTGCG
jgi:hypothetical protein